MDQPVSNRRSPVLPSPSVVPPTAIANGSSEGASTPEPSPDEKYMPTPSAAALTRKACSILASDSGCPSPSGFSHELEAIVASGWPPAPLSIAMSALNRACRPKSPLLQLSPPTTSWLARGAMS